jgi:hypothetical protein
MRKITVILALLISCTLGFSQKFNIKDANNNIIGYTEVTSSYPQKVNVFNSDGELLAVIEYDENYYDNAKNYFPVLKYRIDPLANEIKPNYEKLSNSAWGINNSSSNSNSSLNFKIEDNINPNAEGYEQYVKEFNYLVSSVRALLKLGIDITLPSNDPEVNAAHKEWQERWNANYKLGKLIKY